MPAYRYDAIDAGGRAVDGLIEADNPKAARSLLRGQGLVPMAVAALVQAPAGGGRRRLAPRAFTTASLTVWTRQLAGLVGSGLTLERTLTALADEAEAARQRELIAHRKSEVNAGSTFAPITGSSKFAAHFNMSSMFEYIPPLPMTSNPTSAVFHTPPRFWYPCARSGTGSPWSA